MKHFDASRRAFLGKSTIVVAGTALLSSQFTFAEIINPSSPFEGYNPFAEEINDLRTDLLHTNTVKVRGKIYTEDGTKVVSNAKIEVWHLSPGSNSFKHRGKFNTDENGNYQFVTDFPNHKVGKMPRIYFKVSANNEVTHTELLLNTYDAFINETHWEKNQVLGENMLPRISKTDNGKEIQFNITL